MMPLRVAIPNSVMSPTSEATLSTPPETNTAAKPPMSASGRLTMTRSARRVDRNARNRSRKMPATTNSPSRPSVREAARSLSNCPP